MAESGAGGDAGAGAAGAGTGESQAGTTDSGSRPLFRVRTITTGVTLTPDRSGWVPELKRAAAFNAAAAARLSALGYEVQTVRITTNPFEEYLPAEGSGPIESRLAAGAVELVEALAAAGASGELVNIGPCVTPEAAAAVPGILCTHGQLNCSMRVGNTDGVPDPAMLTAAAATVVAVSTGSEGGEACFKFAASFNCAPGIPFFPAGYHSGPTSFAIGLENSGLVYKAFSEAPSRDLRAAGDGLKAVMEAALKPVEKAAEALAVKYHIPYDGIDVSVAPAPDAPVGESLAAAYEAVGLGPFGGAGTLAISSIITKTLKALDVKICGYSGLMLPPLEDQGLAKLSAEGAYTVQDLLLFSSVCGLGLDTVPVPGDVKEDRLVALMADVCCMAFKLNKPLACRVFPTPGKKAGDLTTFVNPHLCNGTVFAVP